MQVRMVVKEQSPLISLDRVECWIVEDIYVPAGAVVGDERPPCFAPNMAKVKKSFS